MSKDKNGIERPQSSSFFQWFLAKRIKRMNSEQTAIRTAYFSIIGNTILALIKGIAGFLVIPSPLLQMQLSLQRIFFLPSLF